MKAVKGVKIGAQLTLGVIGIAVVGDAILAGLQWMAFAWRVVVLLGFWFAATMFVMYTDEAPPRAPEGTDG